MRCKAERIDKQIGGVHTLVHQSRMEISQLS